MNDRVLTVQNPWAALILFFGKDIENRNWHPNWTGRLWIHVGMKNDNFDNPKRLLPETDKLRNKLRHVEEQFAYGGWKNWQDLDVSFPPGHICGSVNVIGYAERGTIDYKCYLFYPWADPKSKWFWLLENPRILVDPIQATGKRGLWEVPADIKDSLRFPVFTQRI